MYHMNVSTLFILFRARMAFQTSVMYLIDLQPKSQQKLNKMAYRQISETGHILNYLRNNVYPSEFSKDEKRKLMSKSKQYVLKNNKLSWLNHKDELQEALSDENDIKSILSVFHDDKCYMGMEKTYTSISKIYHWNGMHNTINEYIKSMPKMDRLRKSNGRTPSYSRSVALVSCWDGFGKDARVKIW